MFAEDVRELTFDARESVVVLLRYPVDECLNIAAQLGTQLEVGPHQDRRTFRADVDVIEPAVSEQRARAQVLARAHRADLARRDQITIEHEDLMRVKRQREIAAGRTRKPRMPS